MLRSSKDSSFGGVMILFAISATAILGMVGLVIELARLHTVKKQATHFARFAALTALDEYYRYDCDLEPSECVGPRTTAALNRTNVLTQQNVILGSAMQIIGTDQGNVVRMTPGRYVPDSDEEAKEECSNAGLSAPCFLTDGVTEPNAMEISGRLNSLSRSGFGTFLGVDVLNPEITARATLVPRRGYFLTDISASTVGDTYPKWVTGDEGPPIAPECGHGHYFALASTYPDGTNDLPQNEIPQVASEIVGGSFYLPRLNWFAGMDCADPGVPLCTGSTTDATHCIDDYLWKRTLADTHINSTTQVGLPYSDFHVDPTILTDYTTNDGFWYYLNSRNHDVEPFETIAEGLDQALTLFVERSVPADRAGMIFFDNTITWPRFFGLTNQFDYLQLFMNVDEVQVGGIEPDITFPGPAATINLQEPQFHNTQGRELLIRHDIVPKAQSFSDYFRPLQAALVQFAASETSTDIPASNFVVITGDLFHNCINCYAEEDYVVGDGPHSYCQGTSGTRCSNSYEYYRDGMKDIEKLVREEFITQGIPIHVIGVGDAGGFHVVTRNLDSNTYYTDYGYRRSFSDLAEVLASGGEYEITDFMIQGCVGSEADGSCTLEELREEFDNREGYDAQGNPTPFYELNSDWYRIALLTQGVWAPVQRELVYGNCAASAYEDDQGNKRLFHPEGAREEGNMYCLTQKGMIIESVNQIFSDIPLFIIE